MKVRPHRTRIRRPEGLARAAAPRALDRKAALLGLARPWHAASRRTNAEPARGTLGARRAGLHRTRALGARSDTRCPARAAVAPVARRAHLSRSAGRSVRQRAGSRRHVDRRRCVAHGSVARDRPIGRRDPCAAAGVREQGQSEECESHGHDGSFRLQPQRGTPWRKALVSEGSAARFARSVPRGSVDHIAFPCVQ